jgi:rfaE bifunctional protein nucleotidyltransferase chain/domain
LIEGAGVDLIDLGLDSATPVKVRVRGEGRTLVRIDHGERPGRPRRADDAACAVLSTGAAILISDYGWGVTADLRLRTALSECTARLPVVWDPHPKGAAPVAGARLVTPNRREAGASDSLADVAECGRRLLREWRAEAVAITLGAGGALLVTGDGAPMAAPAPKLAVLDPCGAGDRFASAVAGQLADGAAVGEAVTRAVAAASAFVGAGGAAAARLGRPAHALDHFEAPTPLERAIRLASDVRGRGGRVVATGGCFDLLHAGHVASLQAARALGDCLLVCLNSDASAARLKGPGRPLVTAADRAAVLLALGCVDAVVVFDEDTPEAVLARLRPDIFAKGGDYKEADLPEAPLLRSWGGELVLLPFLEGRSTTSLVKEAGRRAG